MDFYNIVVKEEKDGTLKVRPDWKVGRSSDLMTRGRQFYAVWDQEAQLWSTDIYDVQRLVDADLQKFKEAEEERTGRIYQVMRLQSHGSRLWDDFQRFIHNSGDNSHGLNETLVFANTDVKKEDYASLRLDYDLREGDHSAWDHILGTLYSAEERAKIEWAIGAVVSGDSKAIQKFLVFYGPPGSGKSTILNIIERLFRGYTGIFDARELAGNNNSFATSAFKNNPLVAIQQDGDLSRIFDNTKLNSIVAHETMIINEKYKAPHEARSNAFLFMGTNLPVKITDAKSGLIRRLIDVVPTGQQIEHELYHRLMEQINFELGAIAFRCLQEYRRMGRNFYSKYQPKSMMLKTDEFYNYVEAHFGIFKRQEGITLKQAYTLYKEYCSETGIDKVLPMYKFREELKEYFFGFQERTRVDGKEVRNYYSGFKNLSPEPPEAEVPVKVDGPYEIVLEDMPSIFDDLFAGLPAQYSDDVGNPKRKWANVDTTLADINTRELHWVQVPENLIVIDFDIRNEDGEKDLTLNLAAASKWPATYTETSQGGQGIHLHYTYLGDVEMLANSYDEGIEIKTLLGGSALRRKLTKCNNVTITPLQEGLPKKEKPTLSEQTMKSEKGLRDLLEGNLAKKYHPGTKPSVDFIKKILDDAYKSGMPYDVSDMRGRILTFALKSTNQSDTCVKIVQTMKFKSDSDIQDVPETPPSNAAEEKPIVFYDIEVYPNLFVVCWKVQGKDKQVVRMVNPTAAEIEPLLNQRLVGFNNRRYDNHILYAAYLGWTVEEIYNLSYNIINGDSNRSVLFGEAYNLSWADIYDYSSKKQGLKKFQIDLGIFHSELDLPWDEPVPEELWDLVVEYCVNDVISTEATFENRAQDLVARQILSEITGLSVNRTTTAQTGKMVFGDDREPQGKFVYTHLAEMFPGYKFEFGKSTYQGEEVGEGGYVYAEPGMYEDVIELDVESMHPTSIVLLNLFGPYTPRFEELLEARLAIKHKDYERARTMMDGKLAPYLKNEEDAAELSYALKIVINSVYGLTSAKFPNLFKDHRNVDNIVAKRGALFMIDLKRYMQEAGWTVVHIKTDSIKIPLEDPQNADLVTSLVQDFGKLYGYKFEVETVYRRFCLVNNAVYIAEKAPEFVKDGVNWSAVGAQFQHPYVYKTLFSREKTEFGDYCETKSVTQGTMYLDFNAETPMIPNPDHDPSDPASSTDIPDTKKMVHVGRVGSFVPVIDRDGGTLWRIKDGKMYAVTGTKGFSWITREMAIDRNKRAELIINMAYFDGLAQKAIAEINEHTDDEHDFEWFVSSTDNKEK